MSSSHIRKDVDQSDTTFDDKVVHPLKDNADCFVESIASEVLKSRKQAKAKIIEVEREISDGARPKKGRFRL